MTIRAHELALLDLSKHGSLTHSTQVADVVFLIASGEMVPAHRGVMKVPPAVRAGHALLQPVVPLHELEPAAALPRHHTWSFGSKVRRVVVLPAVLTPGLVARSASVESIEMLLDSTLPAHLHVYKLGNRPDST
jgi:hypothetical protein